MAKRGLPSTRGESGDGAILKEARQRYMRAEKWEGTWRPRYIDDTKFRNGDPDNMYQWPEDIRGRMEEVTRPMLTINKTNQHVLDILNDARQSKIGIKIRATG